MAELKVQLEQALAIMDSADIHANSIKLNGDNEAIPVKTNNTVYEDKATPLLGKRLSTSTGKVDYNWAEGNVKFQPDGNFANTSDYVLMVSEEPHKGLLNGKIYPHIHWEQTTTNANVWSLNYRIQNNGSAKDEIWKEMTATSGELANDCDNVYDYVSGTLNQISRFKDSSNNPFIDLSGLDISVTIQFRVTRTDSISGDIYATFFDFHYEIDALGSRDEFVK